MRERIKPELLLPAGNVEAFYAAIEGGADAVYLGLDDFNARKRAQNFTMQQLPILLNIAHKKNVKVFVTLNTVIKNEELPKLYQVLAQLNQVKANAVIIQDWGVFHLIQKYFPKLEIHASTQMAFHNSIGANFGQKIGLHRIILARELTKNELTLIRKNTRIELELFAHGALCYSFSGMCLFSSYLGGMSANRGACKQPCRRLFDDNQTKHYVFSLKDNELIEFVPELSDLGINSLKIEGRMKSADYVYNIARAYRMVIDNPKNLQQAKEILEFDIGREKTSYFMGGDVSNAITEMPNTGFFVGTVQKVLENEFHFASKIPHNNIHRIRICSPGGDKQVNLKVKDVKNVEGLVSVQSNQPQVCKGDLVYVTGFKNKKFPYKLPQIGNTMPKTPNYGEAQKKTLHLVKPTKTPRPQLYFRIDSLAWLRKIRLEDIDFLILNIPLKEWDSIPLESKFMIMNRDKLILEFPKFIKEENGNTYKTQAQRQAKRGIRKFMVSHISQKDLVPSQSVFFTNENVYTFNDAAVAQMKQWGASAHVYPLENDIDNLVAGVDRSGIVPLYFTPQLFYSRMPVKTLNKEGRFFDDTNIGFCTAKREGMTITLPQKPVSILQNKQELMQKGFKRFLIDVSFGSPSQNTFKTLVKRYYKGEQLQPSTSFNFKKGLS